MENPDKEESRDDEKAEGIITWMTERVRPRAGPISKRAGVVVYQIAPTLSITQSINNAKILVVVGAKIPLIPNIYNATTDPPTKMASAAGIAAELPTDQQPQVIRP